MSASAILAGEYVLLLDVELITLEDHHLFQLKFIRTNGHTHGAPVSSIYV